MAKYSLQTRAGFYRAVRNFFDNAGYTEVETPVLSPFLLPESSIEVFRTEFVGSTGTPLYLTPSPELWMKRLLASGSGSIYQIGKCFRNGDLYNPLHSPEFTMLEYYTVDADYMQSAEITEEFILSLKRTLELPERVKVRNRELSLLPPYERLSMREAFSRYAGIDLDTCEQYEALSGIARGKGIEAGTGETWEQLFHKVFLTCVEPCLPHDSPLFLTDYPKNIPTLAKEKKGTMYSERWELIMRGVEIANCYTEERRREMIDDFIEKEAVRKKQNRVLHKIDPLFPEDVGGNLPACSGVAMGLDRLFMVLYGLDSIEQTLLFPLSDYL